MTSSLYKRLYHETRRHCQQLYITLWFLLVVLFGTPPGRSFGCDAIAGRWSCDLGIRLNNHTTVDVIQFIDFYLSWTFLSQISHVLVATISLLRIIFYLISFNDLFDTNTIGWNAITDSLALWVIWFESAKFDFCFFWLWRCWGCSVAGCYRKTEITAK